MKFIHLSDLHIHKNNQDNQELSAALDYINKNYPEHKLIITGDITDDGRPQQFDNAYKLLSPFMERIFFCPGNHDYGAVGIFHDEEKSLSFDQKLTIPFNQGGTFSGDNLPVVNVVHEESLSCMLIGLDSNLETISPFEIACGKIGKKQLQALDNILANTQQNMTKIIFFHHHPFMVNDPFMMLQDAEELARIIYGRADLVLFGHKHVMKEWQNRWGIKFILASDNSSDKDFAKEICIDVNGNIIISPVRIRA